MKDTNGNPITEEEFIKDIGHGVVTQENRCIHDVHGEDCFTCYPTQEWKEKIYHIITHNGTSECHLKLVVLVESLLKEKRKAVLEEVVSYLKNTATATDGDTMYCRFSIKDLELLKHE